MVAQQILTLLVKVRVLIGQPFFKTLATLVGRGVFLCPSGAGGGRLLFRHRPADGVDPGHDLGGEAFGQVECAEVFF